MKKLTLYVPLLVFGFADAQPAQAQTAASAASQQLFQDGATLLKDGKVHEACLKFGESERLEPQLGTLLNLAACHEKEGKVATAWTEYTELADTAAKRGDAKRAAYAKTKIAELEPTLPRLQLVVPDGTNELKLDGASLGPAAWNVALPIDPGDHVVAYGSPGKKAGSQHVTATKGQTTKANLPALESEPVSAAAPTTSAAPVTTPPAGSSAPPDALPPPAPPARTSTLRTTGYIVGGVGVVGLGLGTVFGVIALGDKSTVNQNCVGTQCSQAGLKAVDDAHRDAAISTTGFIAGGVCLAAGVTMFLLGKNKTEQVGLAGVAPYAGSEGGGLVGFGRF